MQKMFERNELSRDNLRRGGDSTKTCGDCAQWVGQCLKGKWDVLCNSTACEVFEAKKE